MANKDTSNNKLNDLVLEIEALDREIEVLKEARRVPFKKAKELGFHIPAMRAIIKERKEEPDLVANKLAAMAEYRTALGDFADTDLGRASSPDDDEPSSFGDDEDEDDDNVVHMNGN